MVAPLSGSRRICILWASTCRITIVCWVDVDFMHRTRNGTGHEKDEYGGSIACHHDDVNVPTAFAALTTRGGARCSHPCSHLFFLMKSPLKLENQGFLAPSVRSDRTPLCSFKNTWLPTHAERPGAARTVQGARTQPGAARQHERVRCVAASDTTVSVMLAQSTSPTTRREREELSAMRKPCGIGAGGKKATIDQMRPAPAHALGSVVSFHPPQKSSQQIAFSPRTNGFSRLDLKRVSRPHYIYTREPTAVLFSFLYT